MSSMFVFEYRVAGDDEILYVLDLIRKTRPGMERRQNWYKVIASEGLNRDDSLIKVCFPISVQKLSEHRVKRNSMVMYLVNDLQLGQLARAKVIKKTSPRLPDFSRVKLPDLNRAYAW